MTRRLAGWADSAAIWVAWHVPRRVAYWCAVRVGSEATVGEHSDVVVPDLLFTEALIRWDRE